MYFVSDYKLAEHILKSEHFEIPNLYHYLQRLEQASGESFAMTRCFVNASPFFLENERHQLLRKIAVEFLSNKRIKHWDSFFSEQIDFIVGSLPEGENFDIVENVGMPLFDRIARPLLGVYPSNVDEFDRIATVLQRMVEPMLPMKQRKQIESDFKHLIEMLEQASKKPMFGWKGEKSLPTCSLLEQLEIDKPFEPLTRYAFVTAMYAALAPLVQTSVNMLAIIYTENNGAALSSDEFEVQFNRLLHLATAPKFIHRIAKSKQILGSDTINNGCTVLIDIQKATLSQSQTSGTVKNLDFGFGAHFCVGAMLSKRILKELVPIFMQRFPYLKVLNKSIDTELNIAYAYKQFKVKALSD
jgi:cytochrome P450